MNNNQIKDVNMSMKILTEDKIIKQIQEWLTDCDADMLAEFTGKIFGGDCFFINGEYKFYPLRGEYTGAFDDKK